MLYSASNKVNIIYVTHDQKRDWWNSAKGRTIGPRIELRKEFSDTTGQEFYMYSMDSFLEQYAHHEGLVTDPSVFVEISEIDIQTNRKKRKKQATTLYEYSLVLEKNLVNLQERISRRQRTIDNIKMKYQGKALPSEVATQVENTETKMLQLKRQYEHKLIQLENCRRQLLDEEHN